MHCAFAEDVSLLYRCLSNLADECATSNHGGCWHKDYTVNGKTKTYSACQDNIKEYKVPLAAPCFISARFVAVEQKSSTVAVR